MLNIPSCKTTDLVMTSKATKYCVLYSVFREPMIGYFYFHLQSKATEPLIIDWVRYLILT